MLRSPFPLALPSSTNQNPRFFGYAALSWAPLDPHHPIMSLHCSLLTFATFALGHVSYHPSSAPSRSLSMRMILLPHSSAFSPMDGRKIRCFDDGHNDKAVYHRIMQRFRPIIPKPTTEESGSAVKGGGNSSSSSTVTKGRYNKRQYVRAAAGGGKCKKRKKGGVEKERDSIFTTLQLLPADDRLPIGRRKEDTTDIIDLPALSGGEMNSSTNNIMSSKGCTLLRGPLVLLDRTVETWVTVERVTGNNCMDGKGLGCTDEEVIMNLERDTCPGFISDGENEVKWMNTAYRRMVWEEEQGPAAPPHVAVKLVAMADFTDQLASGSFACWVRVQYCYINYMSNCLEKQCRRQIVAPCDVWRMEFGGLAWRLDVQAALSLGRRC